MTLPKALVTVTFAHFLNKAIELIIILLGERDFFKSGHLEFVHNLKEGLIIVHDRYKKIKLMNVAAR